MGRRDGNTGRGKRRQHISGQQLQQEISTVNAQIQALGLVVRDVAGDGNCLFRAISDQLWTRADFHVQARHDIVQFIAEHEDDFAPFVEDDEDFNDYVSRMQGDAEWGGNMEIVAASRLYKADVIIHSVGQARMEVRNGGTRVIHLCYLSGEHYGSVRYTDESNADAHQKRWLAAVPKPASGGEKDKVESNKKGKKGKSQAVATEEVPEVLVYAVLDVVAEIPGCTPSPEQVRKALLHCDYDIEAAAAHLSGPAARPPAADALQHDSHPTALPPPALPPAPAKPSKEEERAQKEREKQLRNREKVQARNSSKAEEKKRDQRRQREQERLAEKRLATEPIPVSEGASICI
eukprot:TRINITY_DN15419_c0_g1_i1.p1 TRINITY_DN15419_c0_g1~~TRINITY_DN15419_c0_g1_i1.p1  ORF type:complete len:349 (+),score=71.14 TRINITY_DN15419_c0_g1_i1:33-1079(+)